MTGVWQFIGFFGSSSIDDIPKVMPAAVMDRQGRRVVVIDLAEDEATLEHADYMALAHFDECVADGAATKLATPVAWEPRAVLLLVGGEIERLSVDEADSRMVAFVRQQRIDGDAALERGERELALACFDRARRVSSEREDIERVVELEPDPVLRAIIREPLDQN
jgi:hypothetical protein